MVYGIFFIAAMNYSFCSGGESAYETKDKVEVDDACFRGGNALHSCGACHR